jgi:hypothetical protein
MLDDRTRTVLQQTARRLSRSFLQYIDDAVPWTTEDEAPALQLLHRQAAEERDGIARLLTFLQRHHAVPPYLGSFPTSFTTANFVSFDYLRPKLLQHARADVTYLENDLCQIHDSEAREVLKDLLALRIRQAKEVEQVTPGTAAHAPAIPAPAH